MKWLSFLSVLIIVVACSNKQDNAPPTVTRYDTITASATASQSYFPVKDFLLSEIRYVDSLPIGILKYTTRNGKQDSGYIKTDEFHTLAEDFLVPQMEKTEFERLFKETSFFDGSTQASTFTYFPINENSQIKRIDVIAKESNMGYNKVYSIYIEKENVEAGVSTLKKLFWMAGKNFQIITVPDSSGKNGSVVKVVWNYWD